MNYLECYNYTVVVWDCIDCGSLNISVYLYLVGIWQLTVRVRLCPVLIYMSHLLPHIFFHNSIHHYC